ncbi:MAG: signal recognition particle protein [Candidatus Marinimicrobia bacterium]|jgi:signal recognition particle subunit SRP54|nr:signal recognition particle protein [Candidatus Neomarinimicrobiota bacterium]|tara:strand:+ start:206 stop:1534 length:1329 start_codon:yes stop_codon:yes gene_type:complete
MFEQLQEKFGLILRNLRGLGKITEKNISETSRQIRRALLEADVNLQVAKDFVASIEKKAQGSSVLKSVTPGQQFAKIIHDELTSLLGREQAPLTFAKKPPTVILLAGLQGSGKTTTASKLAYLLKKDGKKPYLVAADVYRPAAVEQLQILGKQIDVPVWTEERDPVDICVNGIDDAKRQKHDVVILDTAGRLHVDSEMMEEIVDIAEESKPTEILFVADGMTGQDAVNSANAFSDALEITGTVLTKLDGDARGGAAVSIAAITGKPIKFVGVSEKMDGLESFHPDRMAGRILGMGDVISLVEKAQDVVDRDEAEKNAEKLQKMQFTLEDFQEQLKQMQNMGSMEQIMGMIPGMGKMTKNMVLDERQLLWTDAIINSMTKEERQNPMIINGSRRKRIARGSGRSIQEVNTLLKQFGQMQKMMKNLSRSKVNRKMMGQLNGLLN